MFCLAVLSLFASSFAANYALLAAGSHIYLNYRHQSDVYRSYKLLIKHGFDPANIITMAANDIAFHPLNFRFSGKVYNEIGGPDVYIGASNHDYTGQNVTKDNFLGALSGNTSQAQGKVLNTTSEDNIFVYYNDHGYEGCVSFVWSDPMYADELRDTLIAMHNASKYNKLVIFVEACLSGSMFNATLPSNINVYAMTASDDDEDSYAAVCDHPVGQCVSNQFSQAWMNYADYQNISATTLSGLHAIAVTNTPNSTPHVYGTTSMGSDLLLDYISGPYASQFSELFNSLSQANAERKCVSKRRGSTAYLDTLADLAEEDPTSEYARMYAEESAQAKREKSRSEALEILVGSLSALSKKEVVETEGFNWAVYRQAIKAFETRFGRLSEYSGRDTTRILYSAVRLFVLTEASFARYEMLLDALK